MSDVYKQHHKNKKRRFLDFITDLKREFNALTVIGLILFIVIPVLLSVVKIGSFFVFPVSVLGAFLILVALLKKS